MNIVLDNAAEYTVKTKATKQIGKCLISARFATLTNLFQGRILLKGDNITLIQTVQ